MSFIRSLYRRQSEALYDYLVWRTSLMITTCESGMARRSSGKCESGVPSLVAVVPFFSETRILGEGVVVSEIPVTTFSTVWELDCPCGRRLPTGDELKAQGITHLVWHSRSGRDFAPCTTRVVI